MTVTAGLAVGAFLPGFCMGAGKGEHIVQTAYEEKMAGNSYYDTAVYRLNDTDADAGGESAKGEVETKGEPADAGADDGSESADVEEDNDGRQMQGDYQGRKD